MNIYKVQRQLEAIFFWIPGPLKSIKNHPGGSRLGDVRNDVGHGTCWLLDNLSLDKFHLH